MSENVKPEYRAGGWTVKCGEREGILVYCSVFDRTQKVEVFFDKTTATRFAHTVLEAQIRFWDIEWYPEKLKKPLKAAAQRIGMEVSEPYREGCPFCQYVADTEADMREHLKEHEIEIVIVREEAEG